MILLLSHFAFSNHHSEYIKHAADYNDERCENNNHDVKNMFSFVTFQQQLNEMS